MPRERLVLKVIVRGKPFEIGRFRNGERTLSRVAKLAYRLLDLPTIERVFADIESYDIKGRFIKRLESHYEWKTT